MSLHVLASGVDRLELSAQGSLRNEVLPALEVAKLEAQRLREPALFRFSDGGRGFLVQAGGRRGYPYLLVGADFELMVRRNGSWPPVLVQIGSDYLHDVGAERASAEVVTLLLGTLFVVPPDVVVSRVDVYADVQGWELEEMDGRRFTSRARKRTTHVVGGRLTGFTLGEGGPLLLRVYDKTAELARDGESWLERWGKREDGRPVWRVEFQYRRDVLAEFDVRSPLEVLKVRQDLWQYGTEEFVTLRRPTGQADRWRWPVDTTWREVQAVVIGPGLGARRARRPEQHVDRVVRFLQGSLTTLGALLGADEIDDVLRLARREVRRYLGEQGRTFRDEVRHKRARLLFMEGRDDGEPKAREEVSEPWSGATPPDRRRGGSGALPRLGHERDASFKPEGGGDPVAGADLPLDAAGPADGAQPRLPEGSESNRIAGRRRHGHRGAGTRRWRARDGGGGGGDGRQPISRRRRAGEVGRVRPKPRRVHVRRPSVFDEGAGVQ